jgi:hypothetical protein
MSHLVVSTVFSLYDSVKCGALATVRAITKKNDVKKGGNGEKVSSVNPKATVAGGCTFAIIHIEQDESDDDDELGDDDDDFD